jgi:hypothetical protein
LYAYAIVPAAIATKAASTHPPLGLSDAPVTIETEGEVGALVSALTDVEADPDQIAARSGDLSWLGDRAAAHDRVVTWASDQGPAIPLPPFSLFNDAESVRRMLHERAPQLSAIFKRLGNAREYTVRLFRVDDELGPALAKLSPAIAELEARLATAAPGQRYLLERKREKERAVAQRDVADRIVQEMLGNLSHLATATSVGPLPDTGAPAGGSGSAVLNASFLVAPDATRRFQTTIAGFVNRYGSSGFRVEFTGPWPAYHFVGNDDA